MKLLAASIALFLCLYLPGVKAPAAGGIVGSCHTTLRSDDDNGPIFASSTKALFYEPILIRKGNKLLLDLELKEDTAMVVACPGDGNLVKYGEERMEPAVTVVCKDSGELQFETGGRPGFDLNRLSCVKPVEPELKTVQKSGYCKKSGGTFIEVGYKVNDKKHLSLIDMCYIEGQARPLYTSHFLYKDLDLENRENKDIIERESTILKDEFICPGNYLCLRETFPTRIQEVKMTEQFGLWSGSRVLEGANVYLEPAKLVPTEDFMFKAHKHLSFLDILKIPIGQKVYESQWLEVENFVRKMNRDHKDDKRRILVVTGTYDDQTWLDELLNTQKKIYLRWEENKVPVSKFLYKVLVDYQNNEKCVGFYIRTLGEVEDNEELCKDICGEINFPKTLRVHCCDVKEMKTAMAEYPEEISSCNELL